MSERATAASFPPREELLAGVQGVLAQYEGTAVTVRQLYYRLVSAHITPNNLRAYKNVVAALTDWRRKKQLRVDAFEDRTRGMNRLDVGWRSDDPKGWLHAWLNKAVDESRAYRLARWYGQENRVVVAVEKQALEGPFTAVCEELSVGLAVCRGYPSLSFLREIAGSLERGDPQRAGRNNVVLYFGDFDPSGLNIPDTIERDLAEFFGQSFEFVRVALTRAQIDARDLPPAPVKRTDSRANGFVSEHGEEVYELDAIEPRDLQHIIRTSVDEYWNEATSDEREGLVMAGRKKIARILEEAGLEDVLARLDKHDGVEEGA
jgi:hypothetical protein